MPEVTVLDSKFYRTFPSAQKVLWDSTALEWNSEGNRVQPAPPCLLSPQAGDPAGQTAQGNGRGFVGWQHSQYSWEYALHFSNKTDLSSGSSCHWRLHGWAPFKWRMDDHFRGAGQTNVCVCVPGHMHACASECVDVFMESWGRGSPLNDPQRLISEDYIPLHILGLFLMFCRKGDALASSVCNLFLLD